MNAFEIRGLTKRYDGFALENVSLALPEGCILGLIGENGAGKTTTIKAALNVIPKDGGEVEIFGQRAEGDIASLKEDIGIVMGEPGLSSCLTGEQVSRIMAGIFARWDDVAFRRVADELDLSLTKKYKELSQGNRRREP